MTDFWIFSGIFAVLAVLFTLFPLFRSHVDEHEIEDELSERKRQNLSIFKDRLGELEGELNAKLIDQAQFDNLKKELELSLLSDVESLESIGGSETSDPDVKVRGALFPTLALVSVVMVGASYGLYFHWGAYDKQIQYQAMTFAPDEIEQAQEAARTGDMDGLLKQLYDKLQSAPDNIEGWMLLARTAMNLENYALAIEGYSKAAASVERNGENPAPFYGLLAQAQYFAAGGSMSAQAQTSINLALENDKNETNALGLLAISAFDEGSFGQAISLWQRVLEVSPDHPARPSIEAGIKRAKALLGEAPELSAQMSIDSEAPVTERDPQGEAQTGALINVSVSISEDMREKFDATDSVFIFARSPNGPPMPLAAVKLTVGDLPVKVELSDASAMAPMAKLSNVETVNVVARVSKSGQPIAQSGDAYGEIVNVPVFNQAAIEILINTLQP